MRSERKAKDSNQSTSRDHEFSLLASKQKVPNFTRLMAWCTREAIWPNGSRPFLYCICQKHRTIEELTFLRNVNKHYSFSLKTLYLLCSNSAEINFRRLLAFTLCVCIDAESCCSQRDVYQIVGIQITVNDANQKRFMVYATVLQKIQQRSQQVFKLFFPRKKLNI